MFFIALFSFCFLLEIFFFINQCAVCWLDFHRNFFRCCFESLLTKATILNLMIRIMLSCDCRITSLTMIIIMERNKMTSEHSQNQTMGFMMMRIFIFLTPLTMCVCVCMCVLRKTLFIVYYQRCPFNIFFMFQIAHQPWWENKRNISHMQNEFTRNLWYRKSSSREKKSNPIHFCRYDYCWFPIDYHYFHCCWWSDSLFRLFGFFLIWFGNEKSGN